MAEDVERERRWAGLLARGQEGDAAAYATLLRELLPLLRLLARRQAVPTAHVEDVVQDVLVTLHRVRHTYDPARPFLPWIAAITRRRAIDLLRREGRRGAWEENSEELEIFGDVTANGLAEARELERWLVRAIADLPPQQRRALELVRLREMSVAEAARESGQSEGAVKVNVHRAVQRLKRLLGQQA